MPGFSRVASILGLTGLCFAASFASAAAAGSTLLGVARDWSAYQTTTTEGMVCYALSKPKTIEPTNVSRDPIYLLVSDWPARKVQGEVEVVPGYPYKDSEPVIAQVGDEQFEFFTRNDGGTGTAWVKNLADEIRLVEAMRKGNTVVITGISRRGTHTRDVYSLVGVSAMLDKVHEACSK
jgi:hypothetical protein